MAVPLFGNARRDIGLHQAGDDVRGRTLGGNDEVDAGSAAHLRDTADRLLDLLGGHEHECI